LSFCQLCKFAPVVLQNFAGEYSAELPEWLENVTEADEYSTRKKEILDCWRSYLDSNKRPYIHLDDGGIADNFGLRTIMDGVILLGGARRAASKTGSLIPKRVVVILVNAQR
jgi:NTE family protein